VDEESNTTTPARKVLGWVTPVKSVRRVVLFAAPLVSLTMMVMEAARGRLGRERGYVAGFVVCWALWCVAFPLRAIGWRRLWAALRRDGRALGPAEVALLGAATLLPPTSASSPVAEPSDADAP
jgi:hypothetical protein